MDEKEKRQERDCLIAFMNWLGSPNTPCCDQPEALNAAIKLIDNRIAELEPKRGRGRPPGIGALGNGPLTIDDPAFGVVMRFVQGGYKRQKQAISDLMEIKKVGYKTAKRILDQSGDSAKRTAQFLERLKSISQKKK